MAEKPNLTGMKIHFIILKYATFWWPNLRHNCAKCNKNVRIKTHAIVFNFILDSNWDCLSPKNMPKNTNAKSFKCKTSIKSTRWPNLTPNNLTTLSVHEDKVSISSRQGKRSTLECWVVTNLHSGACVRCVEINWYSI